MSIIRVPQDVPSINEAVTLANKGDTIKVCSGIYSGCVVINKENLKIIGVGCSTPVLTSDSSCCDSAFIICAKAVDISNFIISGIYENGIFIGAPYATIQNCQISNSVNCGILISECANNTLIQKVSSHSNGEDGICCNGNNACIIDCSCKENKNNGISICGVNNLILRSTISKNANDGVHICCNYSPECAMNIIIESKIDHNGGDGIDSNLNSNLILENRIYENHGDAIDISDTRESTVLQNTIECNRGNAVQIANGDSNRVISNKIVCNKCNGVVIGDCGNNNSVDDNAFVSNNLAGVLLGCQSYDNAIRDNCFECNDPNVSAYPPANTNNFFSGNVKINNCCC